ncbi:MAG: phosphonopyruvate decarboxylase [Candidatus Wildermuthbacteria bacterium]|nr:phosphonopyruvate decarboxylase [Candidatus Wildermuthbacteria bacterium]
MESKVLFDILKRLGLNFLTGVPDSGLRNFLVYVENHGNEIQHVHAANEGQAIGIAAGHYLAKGTMPVVYFQNAGLGNTVNPLTSLADPNVYGIPMLLLVGWRGEPGKKDEPQHIKMGEITEGQLKLLGIPYEIAQNEEKTLEEQIGRLKKRGEEEERPVALVFQKGFFAEEPEAEPPEGLRREEALRVLLDKIGDSLLVCTTGKTSREVFELRSAKQQEHRDFLTVGSMGCASLIGLGVAVSQKQKKVFVFDGDGAALMHLGALPTIGNYKPANFFHVLLDNGVHESTGWQPTVSPTTNWEQVFLGSGYKSVTRARTLEELEKINLQDWEGPIALIVNVVPGSRKDLSRPSQTPKESKKAFMDFVNHE